MEKRTGVITFGGNPLTLAGNEIKVGAKAPDFYALNSKLQPVKLSDFDGKVRIISVFPSIDTPVCAAQTRKFNVEAANLGDVQILTVSCDLPFALGRFCAAEGIDKEITLSDHKELDFGLKYGFAIDELRLLSRGVVVVDKDGVVKHVEYVKEITEEPDYDSAIEAVKKII
ncbi:MAG: thiol peroxidase [bacterium]|jgi:thiol peroxidase|nr:thiol peroxidase [bacterium]